MKRKAVLADEEEARRFCRQFLLQTNKPRLLWLVARNKYTKDKQQLTSGTQTLERKILYFDRDTAEEEFIRFLHRVEVLVEGEFYRDKKNPDLTIQKAWVVVYITAYPLDEEDATDRFITEALERRRLHRRAMENGKVNPHKQLEHISTLLDTCLHNSPCRKNRMLKLDVDTKDPQLLNRLYAAMEGMHIVVAAETRGGYHVIVERGPACQSLFQFSKTVNAGIQTQDQWITLETNDGPIFAVPGTNQGGFTVRLATDAWRQAVRHQSVATEDQTGETTKA